MESSRRDPLIVILAMKFLGKENVVELGRAVGQRTVTKAALCLVYHGGGGCEYRARLCHRSLLALSRI
jgi:hypothetical protein